VTVAESPDVLPEPDVQPEKFVRIAAAMQQVRSERNMAKRFADEDIHKMKHFGRGNFQKSRIDTLFSAQRHRFSRLHAL
jgi:hypothetical protein